MFTRRLAALSLLLVVPSIAQAGAVVELVPSASGNAYNPCGAYAADEVVTVDIYLSQPPASGDHYLRMVQLDTGAGDITPDSVTWSATTNHFVLVDGDKYSNTYHGDLGTPDLGLNTTDQFLLPDDGSSVMVGSMQVTMPSTPGSYTLDVLNTSSAGADESGQLRYGYGLSLPVPTEPITAWRANSSELTGGSFTFDVIDQKLTASTPVEADGLARIVQNVIRLSFSDPIAGSPGPIALAGMVEVRKVLAGGGLGVDMSASFDFSVDADLQTLRIADIGANLENESWYLIQNTGAWGAVGPFDVFQVVVYGEVNASGITDVFDLQDIWNTRGAAPDGSPFDINSSGVIDVFDLQDAWNNRGSSRPAVPDGHCGTP